MAWQDELIELETKLASGALSAEEYRRARDELFERSQSSSGPAETPAEQPPVQPQQPPQAGLPQEAPAEPAQPPAGPPQPPPVQQPPPQQPPPQQPPPQQAPPQQPPPQQPPPQQAPPQQAPQQPPTPQPQGQQPTQQGQQGGPFPPPFQWGQPGTESGDSTQVIQPVEAPRAEPDQEDRTQVVRESDPDRTQAVSDPDRTQTVSGVGTQGPPRGQQRGGQGGWTQDEESPPWAGSESTPVIAPNTTWMKQGPESFESGSAKRGRLVGTVVGGVLVVALAVVAIIYFTNAGTTSETATPQGQAPAAGGAGQQATSSTPRLPAPPPQKPEPKSAPASLVTPPGMVRQGGGPIKKGQLAESTFLAPEVLDALGDAGFTNGVLKATTDQDVKIGAFALSVRDSAAATEVAQAYGSVQTEGGIPARRADAMQGVAVYGTPEEATDGDQTRRAVYVLYQRVIILDVTGPDRQRVESSFKELLDKQVAFAPPTERSQIP